MRITETKKKKMQIEDKLINSFNPQDRDSQYTEKARKMRDMRPGMGRVNLDAEGRKTGYSTHRMAHEIGEAIGGDPGKWYAFPTLFPDKKKPNRWIDYGGGQVPHLKGKDEQYTGADLKGAYEEAIRRGEVFPFGKDKKAAEKFSLGSWKPESHVRR